MGERKGRELPISINGAFWILFSVSSAFVYKPQTGCKDSYKERKGDTGICYTKCFEHDITYQRRSYKEYQQLKLL